MAEENILIFGTSADPIHNGHVDLVVSCVKALHKRDIRINQVILMPVFRRNPIDTEHKNYLPLTYDIRFELCQMAEEEIVEKLSDPSIIVQTSRLEQQLGLGRERPSYTIETLEALKSSHGPSARFFLLLGADAFSGDDPKFNSWYRSQDILKIASLVICPRVDFPVNAQFLELLRRHGANIFYLEGVVIPAISSTEIKARLMSGEDIRLLVEENIFSEKAAHFIKECGFVEFWISNDPGQLETQTERRNNMQTLEYQIGQLLKDKGLTLSLAESCTGGLISHLITNVPGSSAYFLGGVVAYAYEAKVKLLGVSWDTLKKYGAVSCETVIEMADGVRRVLNADIGLSVCCIAGPGGATPTKPVGTGRVGLATPNGSWAKDFLFNFDRIGNKEAMAHGALHLLLTYLTQVHI